MKSLAFVLLVSVMGTFPATFVQAQQASSDSQLTFDYYERLAREGSAYAALALGEAYLDLGAGEPDFMRAYAWLDIAVTRGVKEATPIRARALGRISAKRHSEARALAESFREELGS